MLTMVQYTTGTYSPPCITASLAYGVCESVFVCLSDISPVTLFLKLNESL